MQNLVATIYTRVSTVTQTEGTSLETQELACRSIAAAIPADVKYHRQDAGVSGELYLSRPGIQAALADIRDHRSQILVIYKLDRSGRNVDVVRAIAREVQDAGGRLFFTDDGEVFYHGTGKAVFTMKAVFAEMEKDIIRERTTAGKLRLAESGIQSSRGMRPFGYRIVQKSDIVRGNFPPDMEGKYVIDPDEAPWAKEIFARYASGSSLREVARFLQSQGVPPPSHAPDRLVRYEVAPRKVWHAATIQAILKNSIYIGIGTLGKRKRKVDEGRMADPEHKYKRPDYNERQPEGQWVLIHGVAPPLVDESVFATCQERLKLNKNSRGGNPDYRYMFTGMLTCPKCKRGLYGARSRKGGKLYTSYRCRDYAVSANAEGIICNPRHYNEVTLIGYLHEALRVQPDLLHAAYVSYVARQQAGDVSDDLKQLERQLRQLGDKEKATVEAEIAAISAGRDVAAYRAVLEQINAERHELTSKKAQLNTARTHLPLVDSRATCHVITESFEHLREVMEAEEITCAEKNALLSRIIHKIEPGDEHIEFRLHSLKKEATVTQMVTRLSYGNRNPEFLIAARTRSRLSFTAASGSPTTAIMGSPLLTSTST